MPKSVRDLLALGVVPAGEPTPEQGPVAWVVIDVRDRPDDQLLPPAGVVMGAPARLRG